MAEPMAYVQTIQELYEFHCKCSLAASNLRQRECFIPIEKIEPGRLLGQGGFGTVAECKYFDIKTRTTAAVTKAGLLQTETNLAVVCNEIEMHSRLNDIPGVIGFKGATIDYNNELASWVSQIVLEWADGGALNQWFSVSSLDRVTEDMCQLLLTLMHMHEKGIAHLDIKPDNILLVNGQVKLGDFGLSMPPLHGYATDMHMFVAGGEGGWGTETYMAPEIRRGLYFYECDLWTYGILILGYVMGVAATLDTSDSVWYSLNPYQIQLLSKQPNVTQNDINSAVMRLLWCGVPQRQDTHRLFTAYNTQLFMSRVYKVVSSLLRLKPADRGNIYWALDQMEQIRILAQNGTAPHKAATAATASEAQTAQAELDAELGYTPAAAPAAPAAAATAGPDQDKLASLRAQLNKYKQAAAREAQAEMDAELGNTAAPPAAAPADTAAANSVGVAAETQSQVKRDWDTLLGDAAGPAAASTASQSSQQGDYTQSDWDAMYHQAVAVQPVAAAAVQPAPSSREANTAGGSIASTSAQDAQAEFDAVFGQMACAQPSMPAASAATPATPAVQQLSTATVSDYTQSEFDAMFGQQADVQPAVTGESAPEGQAAQQTPASQDQPIPLDTATAQSVMAADCSSAQPASPAAQSDTAAVSGGPMQQSEDTQIAAGEAPAAAAAAAGLCGEMAEGPKTADNDAALCSGSWRIPAQPCNGEPCCTPTSAPQQQDMAAATQQAGSSLGGAHSMPSSLGSYTQTGSVVSGLQSSGGKTSVSDAGTESTGGALATAHVALKPVCSATTKSKDKSGSLLKRAVKWIKTKCTPGKSSEPAVPVCDKPSNGKEECVAVVPTHTETVKPSKRTSMRWLPGCFRA